MVMNYKSSYLSDVSQLLLNYCCVAVYAVKCCATFLHFFQVNWDKELLYRDFSLISCHLYCHFHLPFWIEALNGL